MTATPTRQGGRVAAGRLWAASRFPYLASALFAMEVVRAPGTGTCTVDDSWRLYVDPTTVDSWTPAQIGSVLVHHVAHLLRDHAARARARGVDRKEAGRWVRAADAEINDDLVDAGLQLPGHVVLPEHFGAEPGGLAEEYFELLAGVHALPDTCGSGADGLARPRERRTPGPVTPDAAHLLRHQAAHEIVEHARRAGNVPSGWRRWADLVLRPSVDWRLALRAELRRGLAVAAGALDYSYSRPSRRQAAAAEVVLPSLRRPVPDLAVVCDTSGSVTDQQLGRVLAEVDGIVRAVGVMARSLRVITCDAAAHEAQRVMHAREVELIGGGGTDMGIGIRAAARLRPRPTMIVVLTDGDTPWPSAAPLGIPVVVGLLDETGPLPPNWARCVRIPEEA
jgi:predicted metal-dependent peptidase